MLHFEKRRMLLQALGLKKETGPKETEGVT